jgi:aspartate/glutamate racemase
MVRGRDGSILLSRMTLSFTTSRRFIPTLSRPGACPTHEEDRHRGGVGWRSTADYYAGICLRSERWHHARNLPGVPATPEISIESLDLATAVSYLGTDGDEESWAQFDGYHRAALERLEASGADFALIASTRRTIGSPRFGIPVINIFDEAAKQSARSGARQVPILGTPLTMTSPGFRAAFARYGAAAAGPAAVVARAMTAGGLS